MSTDRVTVVCATYNAAPAVSLTFASFFRNHPGDRRVFVADNGSTDGALEELRRWPVDVVTLPERVARERRRLARDRAAAARAGVEHLLVDALAAEPDPDEMREHGATLDWLVSRVRTEYALVLDSDVEFKAPVVDEMVALADSRGLDALGLHEAGRGGYRPRLAPYVLLLRTVVVRELGVSFRGGSTTEDPEEQARWFAHARQWELDPADIDRFPTTRIYPTAAHLFERLDDTGHRWADLPDELARRFHHYGHLSWGGLDDEEGGSASSRRLHTRSLNAVLAALAAYE